MSKRYAIISDIHGNLHAFMAVLGALGEHNVDEIICLGDIVGYGPAPDRCIDLVCNYSSITVRGNHDEAAIDPLKAELFNGAARQAIYWTRDYLSAVHIDALNRLKPVERLNGTVMCVHDCPVPAPTDYVHDKQMATLAFRGVDAHICLLGHTHVPIVFEAPCQSVAAEYATPDLVAWIPRNGEDVYLDPCKRYICNPGSVGQPRDCDPRASFAVLDLDRNTFTVHRVEYDIAAAQAATQEAGLPSILAQRLAIGA